MRIHQHEDSDEPVCGPQEDHYTGCLLVADEDEGEGSDLNDPFEILSAREERTGISLIHMGVWLDD